MKTTEQVLTEMAKDEFLFDMGFGPVILNRAEMLATYQGTLTEVVLNPVAIGQLSTGKNFKPELSQEAHRHGVNGMVGGYTFMDFLRFEGFEDIVQVGKAAQLRIQTTLGIFGRPPGFEPGSLP